MKQEPRVVVITGANSGIGKAATERFAVEGYRVVMACRSTERAVPVRDEIMDRTATQTIDVMELDTSSRRSIETFVEEFTRRYPRLDILIHNAAYFNHGEPYRLSPDGLEIAFATNVVGPYLLTTLLRDHLGRAQDPRVLNVGSNIIKHFFNPKTTMDLSDLRGLPAEASGPEGSSVYRRYCRSKMALLMLTRSLADVLEGDGIAVNYLQVNGARLSRETVKKFSLTYRILGRLQSLFLKPPEFTADRYVRITTAPEYRGITGRNINHRLELMEPAPATGPDGTPLRFTDDIKITAGADYYPRIAEDPQLQAAVLEVCRAAERGSYRTAQMPG
jgi:NAD(P)-dependent dehydrogenase (short-subunit alcohol dehydrogenase family)